MSLSDTHHVVSLLARPLVKGSELWSWDVWRPVAAILAQWIARPEDVETLSHQTRRDTRKPVQFPKLGWSDADAQAWTHRSPATAATTDNWTFASTHVFSPPWSTCVAADVSPSIYIEVKIRQVGADQVEMLLVSLAEELAGGKAVPSPLRALFAGLKPRDERCVAAFCVRPFVCRRGAALVRAVDEVTHSDLDRELTLDALNRGSDAMDRRCKVTSDAWHPLFP